MEKKTENYFIDFIRFICAFMIMFYHSWVFSATDNSLFGYGYLAVNFYFILTGYLMINSLKKRDDSTYQFVKHKIKRLLPGVLVAFVICYLFAYGRTGFDIKVLLSNQAIGDLLNLRSFGVHATINSAWWYMSAMLFVTALLYPLARKYKENFTHYLAPLIIVITLALINYFEISMSYHSAVTTVFTNGVYKGFIYICLGCIAFDMVKNLNQKDLTKLQRIVMTIYEIGMYVVLFANMQFNFMGSIIFAILLTLNIAISFSDITYTKKAFKSKIWKKLGNYGFYLYLTHEAIRTFMLRRNNYDYSEMLLKYVVISLIVAVIVYIILEYVYPFIKKKRNHIVMNH